MKEAFRLFLKQKHHHLFWASYALLVLAIAVLGMLGGLLFGYAIDLPEVAQLEQERPNIVSYVYSEDNIGTLFP